jgi:hypothetical protein
MNIYIILWRETIPGKYNELFNYVNNQIRLFFILQVDYCFVL